MTKAYEPVPASGLFPPTPTDRLNDPAVHIAELTAWLAAHPKQRGTQQYTDRETSLQRWCRKAQLIATK